MQANKIRLLGFILVGIAIAFSFIILQPLQKISSTPELSVTASTPESNLEYKVYNLPKSTVYTLLIPTNSRFKVSIALSPTVDKIENFAKSNNVVAVLNGGFFDPKNSKTTSYVIQNGQLIADPKQNEQLMQNPNLTSYLDKILNRSEWRQYRCGEIIKYAIAFHNDPILTGCSAIDILGGGPRLLPELTAQEEGFIEVANDTIIRDALGMRQANARTAVGITQNGDLIWVMAAQQSNSPTNSGLSLPELADFFKSLDVREAINLDGGSSSAFYYRGQTFYGKVDRKGNSVKRPVKSVLLVREM